MTNTHTAWLNSQGPRHYADYAPNEREVEMVDRAFGDDQVA
jgi:hypothetical protein